MTIERSWAFFFLLFLLPAALNLVFRLRALEKLTDRESADYPWLRDCRQRMTMRSICWMAALALLCAALSGPSWGSAAVPVQRRGTAVCLVFDISWSMTAKDADSNGLTRLEAAAQYAEALLGRFEGAAVSVALAKGTGLAAVPLTEDLNAVIPLLRSLSPGLMTAPGSDIGAGITAAVRSFPAASGAAPAIIVFTDGEETIGSLAESVVAASGYGIPVFLLGFGNAKETEIISGDGVTLVKTALRSDKLKAAAKSAKTGPGLGAAVVTYVEAAAPGSAALILKALARHAGQGVIFESRPIPRYQLFLALALAFFIAGLALPELHPKSLPLSLYSLFLCLSLPLLLSGCSASLAGGAKVLEGAWHWQRGDYQRAAADFLDVTGLAMKQDDLTLLQYGLYGLGAVSVMQGEYEAALERLDSLSPDAPDALRFAALYNSGVMAYHTGTYERAAAFFRKALEIDPRSVDAKLNLELAGARTEMPAAPAEEEVLPATGQDDRQTAENALFSIIREQEQNRWKNSQTTTEHSGTPDY
ncbi:MAG: VWA domain-containing protein [Treponema sp.]|jgi:Ca-activated chloride channel family protein|nr:VWA domain-containing protein [Treponema sp.]